MKRIILLVSFLCALSVNAQAVEEGKDKHQYDSLVTLFFSAARIGNNEVIETFASHGFPIDQRNNQSYTALMVAAYQGNGDTVRLLLDLGANACIQDKRGNTAMMGALIKGEVSIARDLYQTECSPELRNKAGLSLEEFANVYGQSDVLKSFESQQNHSKP